MNKKELQMMFDIAKRAEDKGLLCFDRLSLVTDLKIVTKDHDIKLEELLKSDDCNFAHDILGIQNNVDRKTKKFNMDFLPRFS